jgi:hypothetical protein
VKRSHDGCNCGFRMLSWSHLAPKQSIQAEAASRPGLIQASDIARNISWAQDSGSNGFLPYSLEHSQSFAGRSCSGAMAWPTLQRKVRSGVLSQPLHSRSQGSSRLDVGSIAPSATTRQKCGRFMAVMPNNSSSQSHFVAWLNPGVSDHAQEC